MKAPNANDFNDPAKEQEAIEAAAYAQISALEAASIFALTVEKLEFSPSVRADFDKALKRCINALASQVPSQWKGRVLAAMTEVSNELDESEAPAEQAQQTSE